ISADGSTALIGAGADNTGQGAVWVFTRSESSWTQQGPKLTGVSEEIGQGHFGCCGVALSADRNTALIGAYAHNKPHGAAWAFTRSGSTWTQESPKLACEKCAAVLSANFGYSVALSADGSTALIGADGEKQKQGVAYVFTHSEAGWTQQGPKLT